MLRQEAERLRTSREYEELLKMILRLVKRLPNETIETHMTSRDVLADELANFVSSMADKMEEGFPGVTRIYGL